MTKPMINEHSREQIVNSIAEEIVKQFPKILKNIDITFAETKKLIEENDELIDSNMEYLFLVEIEEYLEHCTKNINSLSKEEFDKYNTLMSQRIRVTEVINDKINLKQKVTWNLIGIGAISAAVLLAAGLFSWLTSNKLSESKTETIDNNVSDSSNSIEG